MQKTDLAQLQKGFDKEFEQTNLPYLWGDFLVLKVLSLIKEAAKHTLVPDLTEIGDRIRQHRLFSGAGAVEKALRDRDELEPEPEPHPPFETVKKHGENASRTMGSKTGL